ncbi:MAG: Crp/Fnr family transcriptional regulator [Hyphomonadaceae bacterium]|nr:Crp/Fnr family transcriptional regulator [Hyphomonadaceae bacterium]
MRPAAGIVTNRLIVALSVRNRRLLDGRLHAVTLKKVEVLFEPGDDVVNVLFPGAGTIASLVVSMRDGATAEAAMIGQEGAIGGIISAGDKPAFTRGIIQIAGPAWSLATDDLEEAKTHSHTLRDHVARYADCLLAQVLQSVACNTIHDIEPRLARWLLATQDRIGASELHLTQEFIAEMLGVQRTYVTRIVGNLAKRGAIRTTRGTVVIVDRALLQRQACECYAYLRRHFERLLPGVYGHVDG